MPGGSSSGSAVAVAAGLCDTALGTDTGGSVRLPRKLLRIARHPPNARTFGPQRHGRAGAQFRYDGLVRLRCKTFASVSSVLLGQMPAPSLPRTLLIAIDASGDGGRRIREDLFLRPRVSSELSAASGLDPKTARPD